MSKWKSLALLLALLCGSPPPASAKGGRERREAKARVMADACVAALQAESSCSGCVQGVSVATPDVARKHRNRCLTGCVKEAQAKSARVCKGVALADRESAEQRRGGASPAAAQPAQQFVPASAPAQVDPLFGPPENPRK